MRVCVRACVRAFVCESVCVRACIHVYTCKTSKASHRQHATQTRPLFRICIRTAPAAPSAPPTPALPPELRGISVTIHHRVPGCAPNGLNGSNGFANGLNGRRRSRPHGRLRRREDAGGGRQEERYQGVHLRVALGTLGANSRRGVADTLGAL